MSQWGVARTFKTDDGGDVSILAHIGGSAFGSSTGRIDKLIMMDCTTSLTSGKAKLVQLETEWLGRLHLDWISEPFEQKAPPLEHWTPGPLDVTTNVLNTARELELLRMIEKLVIENHKLREGAK